MSCCQCIDYQSLSTREEQIRTLILRAGKARDPIECALRIVSLAGKPHYEALSYTWGDASLTEPIEVEGVIFQATRNLEQALRHLRDASTDLIMWVDAVCINQNDVEEKSQQVSMMGKIYQQCSQVRIWLGCEAAECCLERPLRRVDDVMGGTSHQQDPFQLLRYLAGDRHIYDWQCFQGSLEGNDLVYIENAAFIRCWSGFLKVAQSAWWTRMWTVQEVILPKTGILTYDTWNATLEDVTKCGTNFFKHIWDCCEPTTPILPPTMGLQLTNICTIFLSLDSDRNTLAEDEYFDIQEQHLTYGHRQCHNPRDKVYGLLALVGNISKVKFWLTPNYSRSEHHVFYDATRAMLYRDRSSLKCLTGAQYGAGEGKWASWVRDFGTPLIQQDADVGSNRLMLYDLFDASNGTKARYRGFKTWPQRTGEKPYQVGLEVRGKRLGTVSTICADIREGDSEESAQGQKRVFQQWMDAAKVDLSERINGQYYSDTIVGFWRTMLGGVLSVGKENTQYSDWRLWTIEALSWIGPFQHWMQAGQKDLPFALGRTLIIATNGRCYFQTESGGQGLCYPTTQAGDEIWVFDGSNVPFVLRRVQLSEVESLALRPDEAYSVDESGTYGLKDGFESGGEISEFYELVGDCYLDGYMSGEAAEIAKRSIVLV